MQIIAPPARSRRNTIPPQAGSLPAIAADNAAFCGHGKRGMLCAVKHHFRPARRSSSEKLLFQTAECLCSATDSINPVG